jgi:hypothetical protein
MPPFSVCGLAGEMVEGTTDGALNGTKVGPVEESEGAPNGLGPKVGAAGVWKGGGATDPG